MPDLVPIRRALLSVSDKADLVPFARALAARGVQLVSTGGTARALTEAGLAVTTVEQVTGFPEGLDGRVKTLHPAVHGGLLALRDNPAHAAFLAAHGIEPIDLVCINLYPFARAVSDPKVTLEHAVENIDVGGPAMLRAAAKNYAWVTAVASPGRYDRVVTELDTNGGKTSLALRAELAAAAFGATAEYDAAIAAFLSRRSPRAFPQVLRLGYIRVDELRYGENPHQSAALYRDPASTGPTVVNARQLHGKQLSYNNMNDGAAALELVKALAGLTAGPALRGVWGVMPLVGACVIKHTNPCGAALGKTCVAAVDGAIAGDPMAAYGGILAVNQAIDEDAAARIAEPDRFFEVVVAPEFTEGALDVLRARWAQVRLLAVGDRAPSATRKLDYRSVPGGMLVQDRDTLGATPDAWRHVAGPAPSAEQLAAGAFLETVCKYASSNAVVIGGTGRASGVVGGTRGTLVRLMGLGSGQVDRLSACRVAVGKAGALARGAVAVGDAFFPFADGPRAMAEAGVTMIVHPGGSKRDQETVDLCNERGITCMVTGVRHFRH